MKRKINKVGQNTLTVSLPSKWVQKTGIKTGDEVEVEEFGRNLTIITEKSPGKAKRATLNLDEMNVMLLSRFLHEFYREGVQEIILKYSKEKMPDYKHKGYLEIEKVVKKLSSRFIGMEIISQTKGKITLKSLISKEEYEQREKIQQRIYFLVKEFLNEFLDAMDGDYAKFLDKAYDYHDNIAKFAHYYARLLHFSDLSEEKKARLYALFLLIDGKIVDKIRHTSERVAEMKKITPKIKNYLKDIFMLFLEFFEPIITRRLPLAEMEKIIKKRYYLVNRINDEKFNEEELKVISECKIMLDTINDFSETYIALNMNQYAEDIENETTNI